MKKIKIISLLTLMIFTMSSIVVNAQSGKDKVKKDKIEKADKEIKKGKTKANGVKTKLDANVAKEKPGKIDVAKQKPAKIDKDNAPARLKGDNNKGSNKNGKDQAKNDHDNGGKGNAHGKNKGDMSGREFGQERAKLAKLNKEKKAKELQVAAQQGEQKVQTAQDLIENAKVSLEKSKAAKEISDSEYKQRLERITAAEKAAADLEQKVKKAKNLEQK